ncbi:hypothetical protein [Beihai shrimp virus 5]|uniref:hypothetical protein n=1 Tax=Beihai shrimp virus 5 TaxID=1922671 RepID=UPI00090C24AE|nr:hypothetical protein [Beihai shrimp virus 5]APG75664.1 hypothetical protein [Beihai shrimp virus 5]APG75679.1 hypothetical protein [Beihai shrimp virus 5]
MQPNGTVTVSTKNKKRRRQKRKNKTVIQVVQKPKRQRRRRGLALNQAPVAAGPVTRTTFTGPLITSGMDYLDADLIPAKVDDGTLIVDKLLNPSQLPGTHFSAIAGGFDRYQFTSLSVQVISRVPTTVGGGYIAALSSDVVEEFENGVSLKQHTMAMEGSKGAPWWTSVSVTMGKQTGEWYYNSPQSNERFKTTQARFLMVVDGPPTNLSMNSSVQVTLLLKWKAKFASPTGMAPRTVQKFTIPRGTVFTSPNPTHPYYGQYLYVPGTLSEFWKASKFSYVYIVVPGAEYKRTPPAESANVFAIQVGKTSEGSWTIGLWETIESCEKVDFNAPGGRSGILCNGDWTLDRDVDFRPLCPVTPKKRSYLNLSVSDDFTHKAARNLINTERESIIHADAIGNRSNKLLQASTELLQNQMKMTEKLSSLMESLTLTIPIIGTTLRTMNVEVPIPPASSSCDDSTFSVVAEETE